MIDIKGIKAGYGNQIVTDGLVLHLDAANPQSYDGNSNIWRDLSGNGNNGTLINGPTYNNANKGSIVFDGINDTTPIIQNSYTLFLNNSPFTLECWFKLSENYSIGFPMLMGRENIFNGKRDGYSMTIYIPYSTYATVMFERFTSGVTVQNQFQTTPERLFSKPNHFVVTYDGTKSTVYLNSIKGNTKTDTGLITNDIAQLKVGSGSVGNFFRGNIYTVSIYNRSLSPQEILQNYNAKKNRYI